MKRTVSFIFALLMLLGSMTVTSFADESDNKTNITLTVDKTLTYDMVIPEDVTGLSAVGVYEVGLAKVRNVVNASDKTVISYTVDTTDFLCEGKSDVPADYYTDAEGTAAFPTTAVEVYKGLDDAEYIPTMYIGISQDAWNDAEEGTYTAAVTFHFEAKDVDVLPAAMSIADILATVEGGSDYK